MSSDAIVENLEARSGSDGDELTPFLHPLQNFRN
jgi:hypothetical protein